jgi:hypothetical protein
MSQILFVGGGLDSVTGSVLSENNGGFHDNTYAPSCLLIGPAGFANLPCLDAAFAPVSVVAGQTFYGHFGFNFTNPYPAAGPLAVLYDSAGFPWVSIRSTVGSPTFGLYYNSGTGGAPVWTNIGGSWAMPQNTAPFQRVDIRVVIDAAGTNHVATVWNKEAQVSTGAFSQALFTNVRSMQILAPAGGSGEFWEFILTEGQSTVGSRVGYSLANGAGTSAGWTGVFGSIAPVVCTDATNNSAGAAALKTTYNFGDVVVPASNSIRTAWQWFRAKNDGSAPVNIKQVCRSAGTDYPAAANLTGIGIALTALPSRLDVDPATGVGWTQVGFNAAEFGMLSA